MASTKKTFPASAMDERELLARADANYFRSWSLLTAGTPGHEIVEQDGLIMTSGEHHYAAFNVAYLWKSRRPLPERLTAIREYFARKRRPYLVRFRVGAVPGIEKALLANGFIAATDTGMPADEADMPAMVHTEIASVPPVDGLRVVTCWDSAELALWAKTMAQGYSIPKALARSFTAPVTAGLIGYELYLGFVGDEPVATSGLVLNNGVAGVYMVSTVPAQRQHGYGEQVTRQAMLRGRDLGASFASLQSSAMGFPVYQRMGFRQVGAYRTYVPNPSAA